MLYLSNSSVDLMKLFGIDLLCKLDYCINVTFILLCCEKDIAFKKWVNLRQKSFMRSTPELMS